MTAASHPETDAADMRALQQGEDLALNRLMTRWQAPLRGFLFRYTHHEHDAMDLAQETFVRIYQHRDRFRPDAKFSTWMFQIALNLARDLARRKKLRAQPAADRLAPTPAPTAPDSALHSAERADAVRIAIADLPDDLREAVLLFEYAGKSHQEIASIVGTSPKGVETRLYRARARLRQALVRFLEDRPVTSAPP